MSILESLSVRVFLAAHNDNGYSQNPLCSPLWKASLPRLKPNLDIDNQILGRKLLQLHLLPECLRQHRSNRRPRPSQRLSTFSRSCHSSRRYTRPSSCSTTSSSRPVEVEEVADRKLRPTSRRLRLPTFRVRRDHDHPQRCPTGTFRPRGLALRTAMGINQRRTSPKAPTAQP